MVKKLLRAENGISHIQSSGAKSSTLLLTFPGRGGTTQKEKEEESAGGEQERKKNTQWGFLTSLGLISSSSSPHFVLHGGVLDVFLPFFVSFFPKLFYAGRLLPFQAVLGAAGRNARRHRDTVSGLCNWTTNKLSRVK